MSLKTTLNVTSATPQMTLNIPNQNMTIAQNLGANLTLNTSLVAAQSVSFRRRTVSRRSALPILTAAMAWIEFRPRIVR